MNYRCVIFDMDGTLLDSIPYWNNLAGEYMRELHVDAPEDLDAQLASMSLQEAARFLKSEFSLKRSEEVIYRELCSRIEKRYREDIMPKPGVKKYLERQKEQGIPMCLATASSADLGRPALERNGILDCFEFLLDCGMTGAGKTQPDIYYLAAERFGLRPEECLVVEDAAFALRTAKRAGFQTIGVYERTEPDAEEAKRYSDRYIMDFEELLEQ